MFPLSDDVIAWAESVLAGPGTQRLDMKYRVKTVTAGPNFQQIIGVLGRDIKTQNSLKMYITHSGDSPADPITWPWRWQ